ncbi:MAG: hypothetical protein V3S46_07405, partial [Nitrospinota bacterium]
RAPARIDLAGGTLDIWPLSVIFAPSVSINVAVDLYATVRAEKTGKKKGVKIHSKELGKTIIYAPDCAEKAKTLFHRALDIFPAVGYEFHVDTVSPAGAGLGGSSALLIAFIKALLKIKGKNLKKEEIIETAQNIEARHLGIPTGVQDYVAAINGGVNAVHNLEGRRIFEKLKIKRSEIEKNLLLVYSGKSRISGVPNWIMLKKAVEGDRKTVRAFKKIAGNSLLLLKRLREGRFSEVGPLIDIESDNRSELGKSIIPPAMSKVFSEIKKAGGHPKVCGAGGGGCFLVWCKPERRNEILALVKRKGLRSLDFKIASPGAIRDKTTSTFNLG